MRSLSVLAFATPLLVSSLALPAQAEAVRNALTNNALTNNAITSNAITSNAITANALSGSAVIAPAASPVAELNGVSVEGVVLPAQSR